MKRTFMKHTEVRRIRVDILRCSQDALASQLLNPFDGVPISESTVSRWESGTRPVSLWAARHIRLLESAALRHDTTEEE